MKLNTKMRYGTRALVELARRHNQEPVSLHEIAVSQDVSVKYLEALFAALRAASMVRAKRGAAGGYMLARPPEEITLRDIYEVLDGAEPYVLCTDEPESCARWATCATQRVWAEMYQASMAVLAATTLASLLSFPGASCQPAWSYEI